MTNIPAIAATYRNQPQVTGSLLFSVSLCKTKNENEILVYISRNAMKILLNVSTFYILHDTSVVVNQITFWQVGQVVLSETQSLCNVILMISSAYISQDLKILKT